MEKYSRFRDESTGIAPFQEPRKPYFNLIQTVALWLFGLISTMLGLLSLAGYFLLFKWILPGFLSRLFLNYAVLFPLRLLYVSVSYDGERRASVRQKQIRRIQPGDVLLSNFVSPVDPLVFESKMKTHFAFPTPDGHYELASTYGAIERALTVTLPAKPALSGVPNKATIGPKSGKSLSVLSQAALRAGAVLVVFIEGTTTNGRGILTLKRLGVRDIVELDTQVYATALRYTPANATATIPSSLIGYVWRLTTSSWWYMSSARISGDPLVKGTITRSSLTKCVSTIGRLRILGDRLDVYSKEEYVSMLTKKKG